MNSHAATFIIWPQAMPFLYYSRLAAFIFAIFTPNINKNSIRVKSRIFLFGVNYSPRQSATLFFFPIHASGHHSDRFAIKRFVSLRTILRLVTQADVFVRTPHRSDFSKQSDQNTSFLFKRMAPSVVIIPAHDAYLISFQGRRGAHFPHANKSHRLKHM